MKVVFCILAVIANLSSIRTAPADNAASLADKLNQFVTFVDDGFQNLAQTLRTLRDGQEVDHKALLKLIELEKQLKRKQQVGHADLQRQISEIVDALTKSLATFDKLNTSVTALELLVPKCPPSWKSFDNYCYKFVANQGVPNVAYAACKRLGATLTRIRSAKQQQFLLQGVLTPVCGDIIATVSQTYRAIVDLNRKRKRQIESNGGRLKLKGLPVKHLIVGGNDRDTEGTWVWPDGVVIKDGGYTNWYPGRPKKAPHDTRLDCMFLHYGNGKWYDENCKSNWGTNFGYVCEKISR